jgi:hypothetical protein
MANIAKVLFNTIDTAIGKAEVWSDDREQVAEAIKAGDKVRTIDYLYLPGIVIKASGKKPASFHTMPVSEFKKMAVCVANPAMPASVYMSMTDPLINSACLSDDNTIRETFEAITKMVDEYEATKPAASSPIRNVEDYMVSTLANAFLIAAGVSGNIPETLDVSKYLVKALAEAKDKAEKLGMDSNGQFRLKKAKDSNKAEDTTEAGE